MPHLSSQSQALLTSFGQQQGVTADQVRNLEGVINSSPALIDQVNAAVASGYLTKFQLLPAGTHAGGTYDGQNKAINLPASALTMTGPRAQTQANDLTFVLGHEIQHSFNHAATQQAYSTFSSEVESAALTTHDYTGPIGKLIAANRRDEASAEIAGWNALAGRVSAANPAATLGDMHGATWRAADFVARTPGPPASYSAQPNLAINADLTIAPTAANIEAMGQNYFDKSPSRTGLGHHGNSDYANYYGAYAVGVASRAEQRHLLPGAVPQMTLNMSQLRLSEKLMEENGINLGTGTPAPQRYLDSSTQPPTQHQFDHTSNTYTHIPISAQEFERSRGIDAALVSHQTPDQAGHPRHRLYQQCSAGVDALDQQLGRLSDHSSERMKASLTTLAVANGLERVDQVQLSKDSGQTRAGQNVFIVQGDPTNPAHLRAYLPTDQAVSTPVEASFRELAQIDQRQQSLQNSQAVTQQQDAPGHGPRTLSP
jgi:hypothetical protein